MYSLFKLDHDSERSFSQLGERQRALVTSALNYNSLVNSNEVTKYNIFEGAAWQFPILTGKATLKSDIFDGLAPVASLSATPEPHDSDTTTKSQTRSLLVPPENATAADAEQNGRQSATQRVYRFLENHDPLLLDDIREQQRKKRTQAWYKPVKPFDQFKVCKYLESAGGNLDNLVAPHEAAAPREKAVIIGMHWLQAGGAERWAVETVALAKSKSLLPIVITDRGSFHPWITDEVFSDALVLTLTFPLEEPNCDEPLLRALFERFEIRGVLIHHCQWLYDRLYWVKHFYPQCPTVDTLHILEYKCGGGYPHEAIAHDRDIDLHHVISPQLEEWFIEAHHIPKDKVVDAPLVDLTVSSSLGACKPRTDSNRLTIAFIGRIARQKRPEAFILVAKALAKTGVFRFIMHGSGEMDGFVDSLIERYGLQDVVERRSMDMPVSETYEDSDVLLVSSINEGITLTSIEAITAGIPVLSANVGSQDTLIPPQGLLRRMTVEFVRDAKRSLTHILEREDDRKRLWETEWKRLHAFSAKTSANEYFKHMLNEWSK